MVSQTAGTMTTFRVRPSQLVRALTHLSPSISALVVGVHGIGKSQIVRQVAENLRQLHSEHEWPVLDRRLSQLTEGDIVGVPHAAEMERRGVTRFLPVDWVRQACEEPCVVLLDELNRASEQVTAAAFQVVLDRELNGERLHPLTRVIACVNPPDQYLVNQVDKALLDRFAVFFLQVDVSDWLEWARGRLDDALVDFIQENPSWLHHDVSSTSEMEVAPTPRSWEMLDRQLAHAGIPPSECQGRAAPDLLPIYAHALIGQGASVAFLKWLRDREVFLSAEDVLDHWTDERIQRKARRLRHEEILSCVSRIGEDSKSHTWSDDQVRNLVDFALSVLSGEDKVALFTSITRSGNTQNIVKVHNTPLTDHVVDACNKAEDFARGR